MRILLLGAGLQGKAALYDLANSPEVEHIIAADQDIASLEHFASSLAARKVETVRFDAADRDLISQLMQRVEAVIALLPSSFNEHIARLAVENGVHFINSSYKTQGLKIVSQQAAERGLSILPEFGFDPGIDLVLAGQAVRELDQVEGYYSYGSGVPETKSASGPLSYKISWSFAGVLKAYQRDARLVQNGEIVEIPGRDIFAPHNVHTIDIPGFGPMEAYPNGDVIPFLEELGIMASVQDAARYATRWPGHCAFWYPMSQLGFLSEAAVKVGSVEVKPSEFVRTLLEPQLQYNDHERDLALLQIEVQGRKDGQPKRIVYQVAGLKDLESGLMAMTRMVGFTTSIGAQMILRGDIVKRGLLSPICDVPPTIFIQELAKRDITVRRWEEG